MKESPVAVVTGASSGIGRATAIELSRNMPVTLVARREAELEETLSHLHGAGRAVAADLTTDAGLNAVKAALGSAQVGALVHGAGVFPIARADELDPIVWRRAIATNVDARLFLTQRLSENFRAGSRVLFVGSLSAHTPRKGGAAYCVSKAASYMLQQCLRLEYEERGVLFANTYPAFVDTALMAGAINADRAVMPDAEMYAANAARGELISPATVARFYRWLLCDTPDEAFNRDDWKILDESHHPHWLGAASVFD